MWQYAGRKVAVSTHINREGRSDWSLVSGRVLLDGEHSRRVGCNMHMVTLQGNYFTNNGLNMGKYLTTYLGHKRRKGLLTLNRARRYSCPNHPSLIRVTHSFSHRLCRASAASKSFEPRACCTFVLDLVRECSYYNE